MDWEVARWVKLRGSGSTAFTDLLKIEGVAQTLGLSYGSSLELNVIIDEKLPGHPKFTRSEVVVTGEVFELYSRNIIKQVEKDNPGATIIPILLSSDKTQLTMFGNKTAYPVYMSIRNIPKEIRRKPSRRACILLAYLTTSRLGHIKYKAARRRSTLANLLHACLSFINAPLREAGVTGISIASGDGKLGEAIQSWLATLATIRSNHSSPACTEAGIKPVVHPFWELPYTNIFLSITSDVLHQLYQGIIKHLIKWLKEGLGEAELDALCGRLPPDHNIRLFMKGLSHLNRVTGREHDQISCFLLGIIIDVKLPGGLSAVCLVEAKFSLSSRMPGIKTRVFLEPSHTSSLRRMSGLRQMMLVAVVANSEDGARSLCHDKTKANADQMKGTHPRIVSVIWNTDRSLNRAHLIILNNLVNQPTVQPRYRLRVMFRLLANGIDQVASCWAPSAINESPGNFSILSNTKCKGFVVPCVEISAETRREYEYGSE
ncbi:hypothetical protein B0H19DRAFT_1072211 [Mycena capillaripes]|nr:hypothetical protein B0H19DRAFT_1072211 [Mycena capillaripes]